MSFIDDIIKRRSVRTYDNTEISAVTAASLKDIINNCSALPAPFTGKPRFSLIVLKDLGEKKARKFGTYGFIKNPKAYIAGVSKKDRKSLVDFGYILEKIVVDLTGLGISSCWLGGTFRRSVFVREMQTARKEIVPCAVSLGHSDIRRATEKIIRGFAGSDSRLTSEKIFYSGDFNIPLINGDAGVFTRPLEMVRLAPSASNKQPWRVLVSDDGDTCHFYLKRTANYPGNMFGFEIQSIDMGIALCHFNFACIEKGIIGGFIESKPSGIITGGNEYIISWRKECI